MFLGLKAEWNEGQNSKIKIRSELYKKGCVSDVDEGLKVRIFSCFVCCYLFIKEIFKKIIIQVIIL